MSAALLPCASVCYRGCSNCAVLSQLQCAPCPCCRCATCCWVPPMPWWTSQLHGQAQLLQISGCSSCWPVSGCWHLLAERLKLSPPPAVFHYILCSHKVFNHLTFTPTGHTVPGCAGACGTLVHGSRPPLWLCDKPPQGLCDLQPSIVMMAMQQWCSSDCCRRDRAAAGAIVVWFVDLYIAIHSLRTVCVGSTA